ncbi:MAG: hypothetical protein ABI781_19735, partial [Burkholderiales bacterium]
AVDAISTLTGPRAATALGQIAQRYARALSISARDIGDGLQAARELLRKGTALPAAWRGDAPQEPTRPSVEPTPAAE